METALTATTGRITGSRSSGRLRETGMVPGVVYGLGGMRSRSPWSGPSCVACSPPRPASTP